MIRYQTIRCVYMDSNVLTSSAMTNEQMDYFARHHIAVKLYRPSIWEDEVFHENMEYVCETIYGTSMIDAVLQDIGKQKINKKKVLMIGDVNGKFEQGKDIHMISVGKNHEYASYESYYETRRRKERRIKTRIFVLMAVCAVCCALYLAALGTLSYQWNRDVFDVLFVMLPVILIFLLFLYGCYKGLFSFWKAVLTLLDGI